MRSSLSWFAENHVAANLLMFVLLVAGTISALTIVQEVFPDTELDMITVSVIFLGATPSEVEESVCIKIEEQVQGIDGIKKLTSRAAEGVGDNTCRTGASVPARGWAVPRGHTDRAGRTWRVVQSGVRMPMSVWIRQQDLTRV